MSRESLRSYILLSLCFALLSVSLLSISRSSASSNTPLDTTNSIQIRDPFAACHADNYSIMEELGVKMNRKDITWSAIEPSDDAWNWGTWDARVNNLQSKNMTVLPILDYSNPSVQQDLTGVRMISSKGDIEEWLEYVNQCVERYYVNHSMNVTDWEIWNEANLDKFWDGTDQEFFELQKRTAANLTAQWPDLNILSTGISGHNPDYLDAMFNYGAMEDIDTLAFHPYSGSNYDNLDIKIDEVKEVCEKHDFEGGLWITEVGMSTQFNPDEPNYEAEYQAVLELQATLVPKVFAKSLAAGIEVVVWYCLEDFNNWTWGEANFGLVFEETNTYKPAAYDSDALKPAGYAYKALSHNLNWSTYCPRGININSPSLLSHKMNIYYFLQADGDIVLIAWNAQANPVDISFSIKADGLEVYSAPSYKAGEAGNYESTLDGDDLQISASIDFTPTIFIIDRPDGASPVQIGLSFGFTYFDWILLVFVPIATVFVVVAFLVKMKKILPNIS